jgi:hypothetical protein
MKFNKGDLIRYNVRAGQTTLYHFETEGSSFFIIVDTDPPLLPGYYKVSKFDKLAMGEPHLFHYTHSYAHEHFEKIG